MIFRQTVSVSVAFHSFYTEIHKQASKFDTLCPLCDTYAKNRDTSIPVKSYISAKLLNTHKAASFYKAFPPADAAV